MRQLLTRTALALSGALLGSIGAALLVSPSAFLAMSDVIIDDDPGLLSELAAQAGVLILTGALMVLGAARLRFAKPALAAGALVYASYGLGRLIGMGLHGLPQDSLIVAMLIEFAVAGVLGAVRLFVCTQPASNTPGGVSRTHQDTRP
ncbi:MAG: DUF4345 domain-containing protein [Oceanicaulis sp.]